MTKVTAARSLVRSISSASPTVKALVFEPPASVLLRAHAFSPVEAGGGFGRRFYSTDSPSPITPSSAPESQTKLSTFSLSRLGKHWDGSNGPRRLWEMVKGAGVKDGAVSVGVFLAGISAYCAYVMYVDRSTVVDRTDDNMRNLVHSLNDIEGDVRALVKYFVRDGSTVVAEVVKDNGTNAADVAVKEKDSDVVEGKETDAVKEKDSDVVEGKETECKETDAVKEKDSDAIKGKGTDAVKGKETECKETDAVKEKDSDAIKGKGTDAVKEKETDAVKGKETDTVKGKETDAVKGMETDAVKGKETDAVKENETDAVKGKETVNENETDAVKGKETDAVKENETDAVKGKENETDAVKGKETDAGKGKAVEVKDKEDAAKEDDEVKD